MMATTPALITVRLPYTENNIKKIWIWSRSSWRFDLLWKFFNWKIAGMERPGNHPFMATWNTFAHPLLLCIVYMAFSRIFINSTAGSSAAPQSLHVVRSTRDSNLGWAGWPRWALWPTKWRTVPVVFISLNPWHPSHYQTIQKLAELCSPQSRHLSCDVRFVTYINCKALFFALLMHVTLVDQKAFLASLQKILGVIIPYGLLLMINMLNVPLLADGSFFTLVDKFLFALMAQVPWWDYLIWLATYGQ